MSVFKNFIQQRIKNKICNILHKNVHTTGFDTFPKRSVIDVIIDAP